MIDQQVELTRSILALLRAHRESTHAPHDRQAELAEYLAAGLSERAEFREALVGVGSRTWVQLNEDEPSGEKQSAAELDRILELAESATPGPWRRGEGPYGWDDGIVQENEPVTFGSGVVITNSGHGGTGGTDEDLDYIVYMHPERVKRLAAHLKRVMD